MENLKIVNLELLSIEDKRKAIDLFIEGFFDIFSSITKNKIVLNELFINSIDFSLVYVFINGKEIIGFIGISDNKKRPIKCNLNICKQLFGKFKGIIIQKQLAMMMEEIVVKKESDLYIEFLVTDKKNRNKGIASKLIKFVYDELGYENYYIEVLSKNKNAKRLYENLGFKIYKKEYNFLSLMTIIQGFGYPIKLKLSKQR